jgi:hypothetical protein
VPLHVYNLGPVFDAWRHYMPPDCLNPRVDGIVIRNSEYVVMKKISALRLIRTRPTNPHTEGGTRLHPPARRCQNRRMPLDVQPLSLRRRIFRILVMLGLLALALGLAQLLIHRSTRISFSDAGILVDFHRGNATGLLCRLLHRG